MCFFRPSFGGTREHFRAQRWPRGGKKGALGVLFGDVLSACTLQTFRATFGRRMSARGSPGGRPHLQSVHAWRCLAKVTDSGPEASRRPPRSLPGKPSETFCRYLATGSDFLPHLFSDFFERNPVRHRCELRRFRCDFSLHVGIILTLNY